MPGANLTVDVVPLASEAPGLTMVVRFPAGFVRDRPGGYTVVEEFVVLAGWLEFEGARQLPGDLVHVPAGLIRTDVRTTDGCTAIAWFGGPADFRTVEELSECRAGVTSTRVADLGRAGWRTSRSSWRLDVDTGCAAGEEALDVANLRWWRHADNHTGAGTGTTVLVRSRHGGHHLLGPDGLE